MSETLKYQVALTLIPGVGPVLARNLISYCGGIEAVFREKSAKLLKIPEIGPVTAKAIANHMIFEKAETECRFIEDNKIQALFYLDKKYPQRLRNCNDGPILLYFKGNADLNAAKTVAIVGTRDATDYGKLVTEQLVRELGMQGVVIVSGLAYGIDICAHKVAVKYDITNIGVVGHGLDRIYPANHRPTAAKMVKNGGIMTEFTSGTKPDRENFPARNRIVAGLCDAIIVVESAEKGGALITADIGNSYNRDVFAVPGNIDNIYSKGCNSLIRENKAALIESATDVLRMMQWDQNIVNEPLSKQRQLFVDLSPEEKGMLELFQGTNPVDIDHISASQGLSHSKTAAVLLSLELKGVVKTLPGKQYQLI